MTVTWCLNTGEMFIFFYMFIQDVPGGKVSILLGHSIGHSKQNNVYVHVSCSEQFPR
jgi:hypothetical protein